METKKNIQTNTILGIIIILVGGLFLMRNFDLFPNEYLGIIFRWQSIIILLGAVVYFSSSNKNIGLIILVVGFLGLLPDLWPIIFIAIGGYIIFRNRKGNIGISINDSISEEYNPNQMINDTSIFGGAKKAYQIDNFRGGNITAIFGGSEISLMNCNLAEGTNRLDVFFLFGGSKIIVPNDWNVSIQVTPILGGFADKRIIQHDQEIDKSKTLLITGVSMLGGGELQNYNNF